MDNNYRAQGLSLRLGQRQVIDQVSLTLRGGEMTALIGPNGAGKSTLLRLLTGFLTPDSGERMMDGKALERWSPQALSRRRAVMLQRTQLQADWTVETVIAMGRSPWEATASPQTLRDVMAETGCDHLRGRRYPSLSGASSSGYSCPAVSRSCGKTARRRDGCFWMNPPRRWISITSSICYACSSG